MKDPLSDYTFGRATYRLSSRTHIMGILNVTPDSFSDGGLYSDPNRAVEHALRMAGEGADFIDVGGMSSRPGSEPVAPEEELRRILPVIERLASALAIPVSVDTYRAAVADGALSAGATIVNDISSLHGDARMADVVSRHGASVILMHMQGTPRTMQAEPLYGDVVEEVIAYLAEAVRAAGGKGIGQVIVDPGIGFGKTPAHNLALLKHLGELRRLRCPVLVGPSRKAFIGAVLDLPVEERLEGTAAAVAAAVMNGASIVRVHDVKEMKRVASMADAIVHG